MVGTYLAQITAICVQLDGLMKSFRMQGFTLVELLIVVAVIGILALISIPNYTTLRQKVYNASALSTGKNAQIIEELNKHHNNTYLSSLDQLLLWDANLTDDPLVTFSFAAVEESGYTFTTTHSRGDVSYTFRD